MSHNYQLLCVVQIVKTQVTLCYFPNTALPVSFSVSGRLGTHLRPTVPGRQLALHISSQIDNCKFSFTEKSTSGETINVLTKNVLLSPKSALKNHVRPVIFEIASSESLMGKAYCIRPKGGAKPVFSLHNSKTWILYRAFFKNRF